MSPIYLLFDLDGTLTDPMIGITNSILYAQEKLSLGDKKRSDLLTFIGPPLHQSFMKEYHLSELQADDAVEAYRDYFSTKGLFENTVYEGIETTLQALQNRGYHLALATSKPEVYAKQIMDHFQLSAYFDVIAGSELGGRNEDKADVIAKVIQYFNDTDPAHYLMIGDRKHDAIGAKTHGIPCLGVTYGYGTKEELSEVGCIQIINHHQQLLSLLKGA